MSGDTFHLCFLLRVRGYITSCSVTTEQFIACEKELHTRQQSHWMKMALNQILLIEINQKKLISQLLKLYLFQIFTIKEQAVNDVK
jgi:hypothetical protein